MVEWSTRVMHGLGVALNEATLVGVEAEVAARTVIVTLRVLTRPEDGPPPDDGRVLLSLSPVGRVAASLRHGPWNDAEAADEPFAVGDLSRVVRSFGGCDIYGWRFFDCGDADFDPWADRLSMDWRNGTDGRAHTLDLFQEWAEKAQNRHLDLRIWFDDLTLYTPTMAVVPVDDFIAGGTRRWDAFYRGEP